MSRGQTCAVCGATVGEHTNRDHLFELNVPELLAAVKRVRALLPDIKRMDQRDSGAEIADMIRRALDGDE